MVGPSAEQAWAVFEVCVVVVAFVEESYGRQTWLSLQPKHPGDEPYLEAAG